jgi:CubicO group peptidase (beta-lactamase class C family)
MLPTTEHALLSRIAAEQASNRAPSLVAAVVREGGIVWSGARGFVAGATPDDDTQYRIGSITKTFVATLVMRLRDAGALDLADRVERHVPGTDLGHLTVGQLLSHTSGLTAESPGPWWERSPGGDWDELNGALTPGELKLRPGRRFHYSNVAYGVLGELVARRRGGSWLSALREEILTPLGLSRTTPHPEGKAARGFAVHPFADVVLPEPTPDAGAMAPAGQLWSTVRDLARWTAFLGGDTGQVLHPDTLAEMRDVAAVEDADTWTNGFGLGIQLIRHQGRRLAGHGGSMPGFLACSFTDVSSGTGALAMCNTTAGVPILALALDLISIADEREPARLRERGLDPDLPPSTGRAGMAVGAAGSLLRAFGILPASDTTAIDRALVERVAYAFVAAGADRRLERDLGQEWDTGFRRQRVPTAPAEERVLLPLGVPEGGHVLDHPRHPEIALPGHAHGPHRHLLGRQCRGHPPCLRRRHLWTE